MRAFEIVQNINGTLTIREGESRFITVEEFWIDFTPDGGTKQTALKGNVWPLTPVNSILAAALVANASEAAKEADRFSRRAINLRHQLKR